MAGSEAVPAQPESGQPEPEPPDVGGGAEATGNDLPLEPETGQGWSGGLWEQSWALGALPAVPRTHTPVLGTEKQVGLRMGADPMPSAC